MKLLVYLFLIFLILTSCDGNESYVPMDCQLAQWYVKKSSARTAPPETSFYYSNDGILNMTLEFDGDFEFERHYIYDDWGRLVKDSSSYSWGGYSIMRHYQYGNDLLMEITNSSAELINNEWIITESDNYQQLEYDNQNRLSKIFNYNLDNLRSTILYEYNKTSITRTFIRALPSQFHDKIETTYYFDSFNNPFYSLGIYAHDPIRGHKHNIISTNTIYEDKEPGSLFTYTYTYNSEGLPTVKHHGVSLPDDYYITYFNYNCVERE